jgi:hypothetical protein
MGGREMNKEDLSFVADALLALCDAPSERRRPTTCSLPESELPHTQLYQAILRGKGHEPLLANECQEIYHRAKLTPHQSKVLEMRLGGWTFEEIGKRRGHSKQAAQNIFVQALKKLTHAFRVYPYKGLSEVYQRELQRGLR